ncbi:MAG: dTMP kinase [Woeseiaceae bacterium]
MQQGKFITVEGIEGVGKSTNIDAIREAIEKRGLRVLCSREPGGTPMAEQIRSLLLDHGDEPVPDVAELLLMFAARSLHVRNVIEPALSAGTWVICDRFTDTSRAYQGAGRQFPLDEINRLAGWVHSDVEPDLTILLDAPVALARERAGSRGDPDRIEIEKSEFFERARQCFLELAKAEPTRFAVIDASAELEAVRSATSAAVNELLDKELL